MDDRPGRPRPLEASPVGERRLHAGAGAGAKVVLLYESANFDERHFDDPDRFDATRRPNDHLAFGFGPHVCLGASLARVEVVAMLGCILRRLPDLELATPTLTRTITGIGAMPVRFTSTPAGVARGER